MKPRNTFVRAALVGAATFTIALLALWATGHFPPVALANSGGGVTYRTLTKCTPTGGTILNSPSGTTFVNNTVVTLTADPNPGYDFDYWTGALSGSTNPVNLTMNANKSVCAVFVVDNTIPVITLTGSATVYVECGDPYTDAGATASDNRDGNITSRIVVGGDTVDVDTPGTYVITYNVQDDAENSATQVTRTVIVQDTGVPVITLLDDDPVDTPLGGTYTDAGATALDECEGDLTEDIVIGGDTVDNNTLGEYEITYDVEDGAGNDAVQVTRTVNVKDMTPPVITLVGDNPLVIDHGSVFSDPGATATDNVDGDLSSAIVVTGDSVNTSSAGNYTRFYDVTDAAGNQAETIERTVTVLGPPQPLVVKGPVNGEIEVFPPDPAHVVEHGAADYNEEYPFDTTVFLEATPAPGYVFWAWGDDLFGAFSEVLIADDYSDQSLDPAWSVAEGTWGESGEEHLSVAAEVNVLPAIVRPFAIGDYSLVFEYRRVSGLAPFKIILREEDGSNRLFLAITPSQITLEEVSGGTPAVLATAAGAASGAGEWYQLEIELDGTSARVWRKPVAGPATLLMVATSTILETSAFGLATGAETAYDIDNFIMRDITRRASVVMDAPRTVSATFLPVDTTAPTLSLLGASTLTVECGQVFADPGATAYDERHGILTQDIVVGGDVVDTSEPGIYQVTYDVMDRDGNAATRLTRDVEVVDSTPPVIQLVGGSPIYIARNSAYVDPGATATDGCDTALPSVTVDSTAVNTAAFGSYQVTYNVSDADENDAVEVVRTVVVAPALTVAHTNAGGTTPAAGVHVYPENTVVSLSATPVANFSHWEGDDIDQETDNPINITMSADKSVTAVFHPGVYFPDPNLEQAVRDALAKPTGTLLPSDLTGLTNLDAGEYGIESIEGIQQLTALTHLVLDGNSIEDLGPLASLRAGA